MSNYITTHDADGKAIFAKQAPTEQLNRDVAPGTTNSILYSVHQIPINISTEADIDTYLQDRTKGFPSGALCPPAGISTITATFGPGVGFPLHRTMTLDVLVVVEGAMELTLDSGETRVLHAGDSAVQRATMHKWRNVTTDEGVAKVVTVIQLIAEPFKVGKKSLGTEGVDQKS